MRAQAIGMVDPARWRGHLRLRYAGFSDSPSVALSTLQRYSGSPRRHRDPARIVFTSPQRPKGNRPAPAAQTIRVFVPIEEVSKVSGRSRVGSRFAWFEIGWSDLAFPISAIDRRLNVRNSH